MFISRFLKTFLSTLSSCPTCVKEGKPYVIDKGVKFIWRSLYLNNRYACRLCRTTWRRLSRHHIEKLRRNRKTYLHVEEIEKPDNIF